MKLYIDDIREAPEGWTLVKTITEAINFIARYGTSITDISIDHDISFDVRVEGEYRPFPSPDNFGAVAHYIGVYYHVEPNKFHPDIIIHTANPVGAESLKAIFDQYGMSYIVQPMGAAFRKK